MKLLLFVFLSVVSSSYAKDAAQPFANFTPVGHTILDSASGDLNGDKIRDIVVVYRAIAADSKEGGLPRVTMILFGSRDGLYRLAGRNDHVIECQGCTGTWFEPYERIVIKGRFVSFEQTFGSANRSEDVLTFRYERKRGELVLHKHGASQYSIYDPDDSHDEFYDQKLYGKVSFDDYRIDADN